MSDFSDRPWEKKTELGSLTQSVRSKQLRSARILLFFVSGWLMIAGAIATWFVGKNELDNMRHQILNYDAVERVLILICAGFAVLSVIYLIFGLVIKSYPVPITITALVLFIALQLGLIAIAPENIGAGIVVKVVVIVGLVKAIQSAMAYQRELNNEARGDSAAGFDRFADRERSREDEDRPARPKEDW